MKGPGKYDEAATAAREQTGARGVMLIVLDGRLGSGFSVQLCANERRLSPALAAAVLREIADQIEADERL